MSAILEFLVGLIDQDEPARVAAEDFAGGRGEALRLCQSLGFVRRTPSANPVPACPRCGDGVPYRVGRRLVCNGCRSAVHPRHLAVWELDRGAFFRWLAGQLRLRGEVRCIDGRLWQLGTGSVDGSPAECFFVAGRPASTSGEARLSAYRNVIVLYGLSRPAVGGRLASLLELIRLGNSVSVGDPARVFGARGKVRFDGHGGSLWVGDALMGEVPPGSREYFFLDCLARDLDRFVPYADIKHDVLRRSGSIDGTEEATFCQGLKSRIKKRWIPSIDTVIATTNKADGYRLRGHAGFAVGA